MNTIHAIRAPQQVELPSVQRPGAQSSGSFAGAMTDAMQAVQSLQSGAQESAARFLAGETEDLHRVALDQQRAAIAFDMFLQVRNKVVQAYQEVMRMQV